MPEILEELREAQRLYEKAGVDGCEGARMMKVATSEIERLRAALVEIASDCPCTCLPAYHERSLIAPDCLADLAGDQAREALGQPIECKGRLAPPTEAQIRMSEKIKKIMAEKR